MLNKELENRLGSILAWGGLAITILVTDRINTDPVNVSKMLLLSVVAFSVLPILYMMKKDLFRTKKLLVIASLMFITFSAVSVFTSANPVERGLFGAFGRNTGLLTYISLVIIFLSASLISRTSNFQRVINALLIAGIFNILLSLLTISGVEILTWENPYGSILGTFGNPNFISSFMGMIGTLLVVQLLDGGLSRRTRYLFLGMLPFVVVTVYFSRALQGTMVAVFGIVFAIYFLIRSKEKFSRYSKLYLGFIVAMGLVAFSGILNKGPLAPYLFSSTVKFRGEYWKAGINMGLDHPLLGVGIDSYGIYYRTYRELSATIAPGVEVGTDTAHNVLIDVFSGVGFPGLISYLVINLFVLLTALKHLRANKSFDARFLTIFLIWAAYQLQSIASINQIGLAIWGWLLGGLVIGYVHSFTNGTLEVSYKDSKNPKPQNKKKNQEKELLDAASTLKIFVGMIFGLLVALPPFVVDAKIRNFYSSKTGTIEKVIELGQSWPVDNLRLNRIVVSLANNNQNDKARELASFAALKFPNDYLSWWALDQLTRDGIPEKEFIRKKLHEIDPYNPNFANK